MKSGTMIASCVLQLQTTISVVIMKKDKHRKVQ